MAYQKGTNKMPAPTPCLYYGCPNLADPQRGKGYCYPLHAPKPFYGTNRKERLPSDWATRRQIILKRHKTICHVCGETGADAVDHIIPGDDHSFENLRPIHQNVANSWGEYCHRTKTAKEGGAKPFKW